MQGSDLLGWVGLGKNPKSQPPDLGQAVTQTGDPGEATKTSLAEPLHFKLDVPPSFPERMRHSSAAFLRHSLRQYINELRNVDMGQLPVKGVQSPSFILRRIQNRALEQMKMCPSFADIPGWAGARPSGSRGLFAESAPPASDLHWLSELPPSLIALPNLVHGNQQRDTGPEDVTSEAGVEGAGSQRLRHPQREPTRLDAARALQALWADTAPSRAWAAVRDDLEGLVTAPLHDGLLGARPAEREQDAAIARRVEALRLFLRPEHLGLDEVLAPPRLGEGGGSCVAGGSGGGRTAKGGDGSAGGKQRAAESQTRDAWETYARGEWEGAVGALRSVARARAPRDKLLAVQRCCHCLCRLLSRGNAERKRRSKGKRVVATAAQSTAQEDPAVKLALESGEDDEAQEPETETGAKGTDHALGDHKGEVTSVGEGSSSRAEESEEGGGSDRTEKSEGEAVAGIAALDLPSPRAPGDSSSPPPSQKGEGTVAEDPQPQQALEGAAAAHAAGEVGELLASADDLTPALVWCVLAARPSRLGSQLQYVQEHRHQEGMQGEQGYFLTVLAAAGHFLLTCGAEEFDCMTEAEFAAGMEEARRRRAHREEVELELRVAMQGTQGQAAAEKGDDGEAAVKEPRDGGRGAHCEGLVSDAESYLESVEAGEGHSRAVLRRALREAVAGAASDGLGQPLAAPAEGGAVLKEWVQQRLRFRGTATEELRIAEVPALLAEYQAMAGVLEHLSRAAGVEVSAGRATGDSVSAARGKAAGDATAGVGGWLWGSARET